MAEAPCDHCGDPLGADARRWQRSIPSYEYSTFCATCHARLVKRADERAHSDDDEQRIRGMTATLAGEVWSNSDGLFWFRDPIVRRPQPQPAPVETSSPLPPPVSTARAETKPTPSKKRPARADPKKRSR